MKNITEITERTIVTVEPGGVIAHMPDCETFIGDDVQRWGTAGYWPASCCIDVPDSEPVGPDTVVGEHLATNQAPKTGTPVEPMEDGPVYTTEMVQELCTKLGRKFEVSDLDKGLIIFATQWAADWEGTFSFMQDMHLAASSRKGLTPGQAKGTLNCFRADFNRKAPVERGSGDQELDLSGLPSGWYAVPQGETRLKVKVNNVTKGKWEGWVFVSDGAEYGNQRRYGKQAPGSIYTGEIQSELAAILADPQEAVAAYGRLTGSCGLCGRILEDEESIKQGIGPVCILKF